MEAEAENVRMLRVVRLVVREVVEVVVGSMSKILRQTGSSDLDIAV